MFTIINDIITLTRGDTFSTPIFINVGDDLKKIGYTLLPTDTLYFGLCEPNQPFENAIVKKVYTYQSPKDEEGNILLSFKPEDTQYLLPGKYYYSFKLKSVNGGKTEIATVIPNKIFNIIE